MMRRGLRVSATFFVLIAYGIFFVAALFLHQSVPVSETDEVQPLGHEWEYSWGDSASDIQTLASRTWQPYNLAEVLRGKGEQRFLWARRTLPEHLPEGSSLRVDGAHLFEVYIANHRIFSQGDMRPGHFEFAGFRAFSVIPLRTEHSGQRIYFRFYSELDDIGFGADPPHLGTGFALARRDQKLDLYNQVPAISFTLMATLSIIFYFRRRQPVFLNLSLFSVFAFIVAFYHSNLKQFVYDAPVFWTYVGALAVYPLPVFLMRFFKNLWRAGRFFGLFEKVYLLYFFIAVGVFATLGIGPWYFQWVERPYSFLVFAGCLSIVAEAIRQLRKNNREAIPVILGFVLVCASLVPHFLFLLHLINYPFWYFPGAIVAFVVCLAVPAAHRYSRLFDRIETYAVRISDKNRDIMMLLDQLRETNAGLEERIVERTKQIETASKTLAEERIARLEASAQLALVRERERIFADMHDHLGSSLIDMEILLKSSHTDRWENGIRSRLLEGLQEVRANLRNRIALVEDHQILKDDFLNGLRLIIYRRYETSGRSIRILCDGVAAAAIKAIENPTWHPEMFAVLTEIATNDLKYGCGTSEWRFGMEEGVLCFVCISQTDPARAQATKGNGMHNIQQRILSLNGRLTRQGNESFGLRIEFPCLFPSLGDGQPDIPGVM